MTYCFGVSGIVLHPHQVSLGMQEPLNCGQLNQQLNMEDVVSKKNKRDMDAIKKLNSVFAAPGFCALMVVLVVYFAR
jgi:hypothetical protein